MKPILIFIISLLIFQSCTVKEEYIINDDFSGEYRFSTYVNNENKTSNIISDSTFYFRDIYTHALKVADSLKHDTTPEELMEIEEALQILKNSNDFFINFREFESKDENEAGDVVIGSKFESISNIKDINYFNQYVIEPIKSDDTFGYVLDEHSFDTVLLDYFNDEMTPFFSTLTSEDNKCIIKYKRNSKFDYLGFTPNNDDDDFFNNHYFLVYQFSRPIQSVNVSEAELSNHNKTITIKIDSKSIINTLAKNGLIIFFE